MIDCFLFFNELDLLEIRLNSLAPYVERFVLVESPITHRGRRKPLYFAENKDRFKGFNITHLIAPPMKGSPWVLEHHQREYLMNGITDADPEEIILLSDLDEIPNLKDYVPGTEGAFNQKYYYLYLNTPGQMRNFPGTVAVKKKNIQRLNRVRNKRVRANVLLEDGGWHFSTLGSYEQIKQKVESFAHKEINTPECMKKIEENVKNRRDPFNGIWRNRPAPLSVEMPSGPEWLLQNRDKYKHLFYGEI